MVKVELEFSEAEYKLLQVIAEREDRTIENLVHEAVIGDLACALDSLAAELEEDKSLLSGEKKEAES